MARTSLAIILVVLSAWIAFDFLPALGWAVILAIATWPLYVRFARLIPDQRSALVAPLTFTALTGLLL
ncbi:MAG TPA: AI-2E family transporter, partial [Mesorhizobium sp.]|nr:AI-2E family transporter [Mesorhizobium sp.]